LTARIGTSGWHYKHWKGPFYPEKLAAARMLEYYQQHFDTVELNNTFYCLPGEAALEDWRDRAPAGFCFAVKASRYLTHMKKLKDAAAGVATFFSRVELLGDKLGPVLFQLPPFWDADPARLDSFLAALPRGHRYAFELRNTTWHRADVYRILTRHEAAFCIYELAGFSSPLERTADFVYIRLHGPGGAYQGSYTDRALQTWAARIREWKPAAAYVYFDNDQSGFAAHNALSLKTML